MIFLLSLSFPVLAALFLGRRAGRRDPQGIGEFWQEAAVALAWAFVVVFSGIAFGSPQLSQPLGKIQPFPA